jgi:hypothetical protein
MPKSKWSAFLSLILVFLSGVLVGSVAYRLYLVNTVQSNFQPPHRPDPEQVRRQRIGQMRDLVKLDDEQVKQVERIYDETRNQFEQARSQFDQNNKNIAEGQTQKIRGLLRQDQLPLYDDLRKKHEAERKRRMEMMKQQPGGGPPPR